ncbi:MAG: phosphotransferase [Pseudomonadales bacterium]|jgi:aminoglycoside/choline kinase family phosphotransferase|nr:phosphotransferase [Pseudomonadales bacterium]
MTGTERQTQLERWLRQTLAERGERAGRAPAPLTADASFRRFARVVTDAGPRILVDAPPERENNAGFLRVAAWLEARALPAPRVLAADEDAGFLLVTDLGDDTLARRILANPEDTTALHDAAVDALVAFQRAAHIDPPPFPPYDAERLALENGLFGEWCLEGLLALPRSPAVLDEALKALTSAHLDAPRVAVHLDWHSRNLMVQRDGTIAMVDFQDARNGPQGYDLVSLLRDCYRTLEAAELERLFARFLQAARDAGLPGTEDADAFRRSFDLLGMQRHLKALGIFARLHLRDGRSHALADMPRTLEHVLQVAPAHAETVDLGRWLASEVRPRLAARLA